MLLIQQPSMQWVDPVKNSAIFQGKMYFGLPRTDPKVLANRVQVYYFDTLGNPQPLPQPVNLSDSGVPTYLGNPVEIYANETCSIRVDDRNGLEKYLVDEYPLRSSEVVGVDSIKSLPSADFATGQYSVTGFYAGIPHGGVIYLYDQSVSKAGHNGVNIIAPEAIQVWNGTAADLPTLWGWTGSGDGCYVLQFSGAFIFDWAGAGNGSVNSGPQCSKALQSLSATHGDFAFRNGVDYEFTSTISIPCNIDRQIKISASGASLKTKGAAVALFTPLKVANYDTVKDLYLLDLNVDCSEVTGKTHLILGCKNGTQYTPNRISWGRLKVENVHSTGPSTDASGVNAFEHFGIYYADWFDVGDPVLSIDNVEFNNVHTTGGTNGFNFFIVDLAGTQAAPENARIKKLVVNNCSHAATDNSDAAFASSNMHIGLHGVVDFVSVSNFTGSNSGDNFIEVNNALQQIIKGSTSNYAANCSTFITNFNQNIDYSNQLAVYDNVTSNIRKTQRAFQLHSRPMGSAVYNNCKVNLVCEAGFRPSNGFALNLNVLSLDGKCKSLTVDNMVIDAEVNGVYASDHFSGAIVFGNSEPVNYNLSNIQMKVYGDATHFSSSSRFSLLEVKRSPSSSLIAENVSINFVDAPGIFNPSFCTYFAAGGDGSMNSVFDTIELLTDPAVTGRILRVQTTGLADGYEILFKNSNFGSNVLTYNSLDAQIPFVKMENCTPFNSEVVTNTFTVSGQERKNTTYFKQQSWVTGTTTTSVEIKKRSSASFVAYPIGSVVTLEQGDTIRASYSGSASILNRVGMRD